MKRLLFSLLCLVAPLSFAQNVAETNPYIWGNTLQLESITNIKGGVERGTRYNINNNLNLEVDTAAANWWSGGRWYTQILAIDSNYPSAYTGEYQLLSNIEADPNILIYQFWYEHQLNDSAKLLFGLHDFNSTFYALDSAHLFLNASFGIGPDASQVPPSIFPVTSTALHLTVEWDENYVLAAVYDGVPGDPNHPRGTHIRWNSDEGTFSAVEYGRLKAGAYKVGVGCWHRTTKTESVVTGLPIESNSGCYSLGERHFSENLSVFFQYGRADEQKNQLDYYVGGGITYKNLWLTDDAAGISFASSHNGKPYRTENPDVLAAETIWESTYLVPVHKSLSLQTSLFYLEHPSMNPQVDNSVALSVRAIVNFF